MEGRNFIGIGYKVLVMESYDDILLRKRDISCASAAYVTHKT
jgi:hypothetical protein